MTTFTSFEMRMLPEVEEAAMELTKVSFYDGRDYAYHITPYNMSSALLYLVFAGLRETLKNLENEIDRTVKQEAELKEVMSFFISNPCAKRALPYNFPEASPARTFLLQMIANWDDDDRVAGAARPVVADLFAGTQQDLLRLIEAKGAVQRALKLDAPDSIAPCGLGIDAAKCVASASILNFSAEHKRSNNNE
jgi:hypothetical protein